MRTQRKHCLRLETKVRAAILATVGALALTDVLAATVPALRPLRSLQQGGLGAAQMHVEAVAGESHQE